MTDNIVVENAGEATTANLDLDLTTTTFTMHATPDDGMLDTPTNTTPPSSARSNEHMSASFCVSYTFPLIFSKEDPKEKHVYRASASAQKEEAMYR